MHDRAWDEGRCDGRAVLVSAKTMPCPNKVRLLLTYDEQFWGVLRKSEAKRLLLPRSDAISGRMSQTELLRRKDMRREPEKSRKHRRTPLRADDKAH